MKIDDNLLTKLEILSSLKIEEEKRQIVVSQLSEIVTFVENLNELVLENENASFNAMEGGTLLRKDEQKVDEEVMDIIIKNAPRKEDKFFSVPPIIEWHKGLNNDRRSSIAKEYKC